MDVEMLEKIIDIGREMAENRNLEPLLQYAMQVTIELVNAEYGYLVLVTDNDQLNFRVRLDKNGNLLNEPDEQISHTIFSQVISDREPIITADAIVDPDFQDAESVMSLQLRSVMCVPLISRERVLGAIYVENRSETDIFDEESLKPLKYLAGLAAVTIENVQLYEELEIRVTERTKELAAANGKLQKLALTDPLTGAFNRRHFFNLADKTLKNSKRYQHDLSIIMIDLDHFKQVNDQFGHTVGDAVLVAFVKILQKNVRDADTVARYGGEEFSILMPETNLEFAKKTAERLCDLVNNYKFSVGDQIVHITISLGIASLETNRNQKADDLVDQADKALYKAKNSGRNCVGV
jgi:diguanylate cyclase (GGDEF)-like protein